ncbi:MAG: hypothetical protein ACTS8R_04785 [Arsenophonus sp. NC-QC1-MAG3]
MIIFNPFGSELIISIVIKENDKLFELPIDLKQRQHTTENILLE